MYLSSPVEVGRSNEPLKGTIRLPASKSISNRLLIINALSKGKVVIQNLSMANDSQVLQKMLLSGSPVMDVGDAGTAMRFLTAFRSVSGDEVIMQGSERMHERPIGPLVNALQKLGADITYMDRDGFPPLKLNGFKQQNREVRVPGNISSQFLTALLLVAPSLPMGLLLHIEGKLMSRPYLMMTLQLLEQCGIEVYFDEKSVDIKPQEFKSVQIQVESDWSSAGYWFGLAALSPGSEILLPGLQEDSLQGDSHIVNIARDWGVRSEFTPHGLKLKSGEGEIIDKQIIDFSSIPDLAQTVAVVHSLLGIKGRYTGLESLRIKETDRILALQNELAKVGAQLDEQDGEWFLNPSTDLPQSASINTYQDHRMAMAFSIMATKMDVIIENRDVTKKSYPHFWDDLRSVNFELI